MFGQLESGVELVGGSLCWQPSGQATRAVGSTLVSRSGIQYIAYLSSDCRRAAGAMFTGANGSEKS